MSPMATPTREQVIATMRGVGVPDYWIATFTDEFFDHFARFAQYHHTAGREQGLREAAGRARSDGIPGISADDDEIVADWLEAAAIEQLRA